MTELSSTNRYAYDTECRSETQTRSRKCRGDGTCDTFTGWSGSYKYDDPGCSNQPGTLRDDYTQVMAYSCNPDGQSLLQL